VPRVRSRQSRKALILVVDEEHLVRQLMVRTLEEAGYHVLPVAGGLEALTLAGELTVPPAVLVTSLEMDQIDGVTLSERMRSHFARLRVLFVRSSDGGGDPAIVPGRVLEKPFSPQQLLQAIEALLASR
jgi:CheY-like chemotaxis protein